MLAEKSPPVPYFASSSPLVPPANDTPFSSADSLKGHAAVALGPMASSRRFPLTSYEASFSERFPDGPRLESPLAPREKTSFSPPRLPEKDKDRSEDASIKENLSAPFEIDWP